MTAAVFDPSSFRSEPSLPVAAGRTLVLAGAVFGLSNLFQYGVQSGTLGLHPAVLGLSWPIAVGVFLVSLAQLRRAGGEAGRRVAGWSRRAIALMLTLAAVLLAVSFARQDFATMLWMTPAALTLYGGVWLIAFGRTFQLNMALLAGVALGGAGAVAARLGTPDQYLIQAATLSLVAFLPGLWLAFGRRL